MLHNMGPQSPVLLEKPALQMLGTQQTVQNTNNHSMSPLESLVQFQLAQRNSLLLTQKVDTTKAHRRLDRSISEPCGPHSSLQGGKSALNPNRYKTEMCRPFVENGYCKYGDKCQFAHGARDRRSVPRHPKYKTEYCKTFHTTGICPYGPRCHFIHNEDEVKLGEISNMKQQQAAMQAAQEMAKQAAQIQMQHQLIQSQLQSLVSQVNQQLISQLNVSPVTPTAVSSATQPMSIHRPRLAHSVSVHPTFRGYSLDSTAETPPESLSTSPILSPTFTYSDDSVSDSLSDTVSGLHTPPVCGDLNSSFTFPGGDMSPLQMSPQKLANTTTSIQESSCSISSLSASLQALSMGKNLSQVVDYRPSQKSTRETLTSIDSIATPDRNRLPIFSQIVGQ